MNGGAGNGESYEPTISGDGSVIAYTSYASDIVKLEPVFSTPNVYVYNNGSTVFITKHYETGKAVTGYSPSISEDGNKVVFCAYNGNLVRDDKNNLWDIFLWQSGMQGVKRISFTSGGGERNQGTESSSRVVWPAISGDGNWVAYATTASNMVGGDNNNMQDVFICSTSGGGVRRISKSSSGDTNGDSPISQGEKVGISYDGQWITYNTNADNLGVLKGNIVLQNTQTGQVLPVTNINGGSTARPMLSRGGSYVIAGCSEKYDPRFASSGIFVFYPH
jgi:Tol biopolymer transport system component